MPLSVRLWRGLCSAARSGYHSPRTIHELRSVASVVSAHRERWRLYRPPHLAASWLAIVKLVTSRSAEKRWLRDEPAALEPLASHTLAVADSLRPRPVADAAHSLGELQWRGAWRADAALWRALAARGAECAHDFEPFALAKAAWAFVRAGRASPELLDALAAAAEARMVDFEPPGLASTASAFARSSHEAPALFDAIAAEAARRAADFGPRDLATLAKAFARSGSGSARPALFEAIAAEVARRPASFEPRELVAVAHACAQAGHAPPALNVYNVQPGMPPMGPYVPAPPMGGPPIMFPTPGGVGYQPAPVGYTPPGQFAPPQQPHSGFGGPPGMGSHFGPPPQQPPWQQGPPGGQGGYYPNQQGMSLGPGAPMPPGAPYGAPSGGPGFGFDEGQFESSPPNMYGGGPGFPGRTY